MNLLKVFKKEIKKVLGWALFAGVFIGLFMLGFYILKVIVC